MTPLVRTDRLTKHYGDVTALADCTLEVASGEMLGLLGPNGAGKTTLLQLLAGLRRPTSGTVELFGGDPRRPARRRRLGTTPQETGLPATLRATEVVDLVAAHFDDPVPTDEILARFGLRDVAGRQTGGLSGGQKRRLAVALAFVGRPDLVLLDEPTTGLDVDARHALWDVVREFHANGGTVVLTSHYLEEVEALAERVVVMVHGRVRVDGPLHQVRSTVATRSVRLRTRVSLPPLPGVEGQSRDGDLHHLWASDADALVRKLVLDGVPFSDLEVATTSLEEAFMVLTGDDSDQGEVEHGIARASTR